jgi:hypothetical protein
MDERAFDTLTKTLATSSSRRQVLKALLAGVTGGVPASRRSPASSQSSLLIPAAAEIPITQTVAPTLHYFGLGDSIASGHGLGDSDGPDPLGAPLGAGESTCPDCDSLSCITCAFASCDGSCFGCKPCCRRSTRSYPEKARRHLENLGFGHVEFQHLACTGGTSLRPDTLDRDLTGDAAAADRSDHRNPERLLKNQVTDVLKEIQTVKTDPVLVSLTISANDFEFANVVEFLIKVHGLLRHWFTDWLQNRLTLVKKAISEEIDRLIVNPNVSVVITEIPNPFHVDSIFFLKFICDRQDCYGRTVEGVAAINSMLAEIVSERVATGRIALVPLAKEFEKHKPGNSTCGIVATTEQSPGTGMTAYFQERDDDRSNSYSVPWLLWEHRREELRSEIDLAKVSPIAGLTEYIIDLLVAQWHRHKTWRGDCVHPNDEGAEYIAQQVAIAAEPLLSKYLEPEPTPTPQPSEITVDEVVNSALQAIRAVRTYQYDLYQPRGTYTDTIEVDQVTHRSRSDSMTCVDSVSYFEPMTQSIPVLLPCDQDPIVNSFYSWFIEPLANPDTPWMLVATEFMSGKVAYAIEWELGAENPPLPRYFSKLWLDSQTFLPIKALTYRPVEFDAIEYELVFTAWNPNVSIQKPDWASAPESPSSGPTASEGAGQVEFLAMRCPDNEGLVIVDPWFFDAGIDCFGISENMVSLQIIDEAGNVSTVEFSGSTELTLPYGVYEIVNPATGDRGMLSLIPSEAYEESCERFQMCSWTVLVRSPLSDEEDAGSIQPIETAPSDDFVFEGLQSFVGDWTGTFFQSNPSDQWTINLSFWSGEEGEVVGSIEYLGLCSGDLILAPVMLDFGLHLFEDITTGEDNCLDGGSFNLELQSNGTQLAFTWWHPDSDATGQGTLQKVGSAQSDTTGAGSLEIHAVNCPPGFTGPDYFNTCHDNGEFGRTFLVSGPNLPPPVHITTELESSSGPGIARLNGLQSGMYDVIFLEKLVPAPAYVFCSPDQGATILVDQMLAGSEGVTVPIDNQAVVCDWYFIQ